MRQHIPILARLLKDKGLRHADIAKAMGYKSPSAVGMMLRGERGMDRGALEAMCELAGITVVALAAMSDDLHLAKRGAAVEAAVLIDGMTEEEVAAVMPLLRAYGKAKVDS